MVQAHHANRCEGTKPTFFLCGFHRKVRAHLSKWCGRTKLSVKLSCFPLVGTTKVIIWCRRTMSSLKQPQHSPFCHFFQLATSEMDTPTIKSRKKYSESKYTRNPVKNDRKSSKITLLSRMNKNEIEE